MAAPRGVIGSYLHISPGPGLGRLGALVALEGSSGPLTGKAAHMAQVSLRGLQLCNFGWCVLGIVRA